MDRMDLKVNQFLDPEGGGLFTPFVTLTTTV